MHTDPFILFGAQHIITLIIAFTAFIFIPFAIKDKSDAFHHTAGISIAVLVFVQRIVILRFFEKYGSCNFSE